MSKFKRGDKVICSSKLLKENNSRICFNQFEYVDIIATITDEYYCHADNDIRYQINIDGGEFFWNEKDLQEVKYTSTNKEFTKSDLCTGDVVLLDNGLVEIVCLEKDLTDDLITRTGRKIMEVRRPNNKSQRGFRAFEDKCGTQVFKRKPEHKEKIYSGGKTAKENHKIMWGMLADHPDWNKTTALQHMGVKKVLRNACFACDYADGNCDVCPLLENEIGCNKGEGLYPKYRRAAGYKRASYAHEIANLEWHDYE